MISLSDKDSHLWGPHEAVLRLTMVKLGANSAVLPYVDKNSTLEERDFICEQLLKEYKNIMELYRNDRNQLQEIMKADEIRVQTLNFYRNALFVIILLAAILFIVL